MESKKSTTVKYYFNEKDNKVVKITPDNIMIYYQIKHYGTTGEIKHSYGKTVAPTAERAQVELKDFTECKVEKYNEVMKEYYSKEKENIEKAKTYFKW